MSFEGPPRPSESTFDRGGGQSHEPEDPFSQSRIEQTATALHVPEVLLLTGEVRDYLGMHNALTDAQKEIILAETQMSQTQEVSPGIQRILRENYTHAAPFLRAAQLFSEEGAGVQTCTPETLKDSLNPALIHLGLFIAEQPERHFTLNQAYHDRIHTHQKASEQIYKTDLAQREATDDAVRYPIVSRTNVGKSTPYGRWDNTRTVHDYAVVSNTVLSLRDHAREQIESAPDYTDEDANRYDRINRCLSIALQTLQERSGRHTSALTYVTQLNDLLHEYNLYTDVIPPKEPPMEDHETTEEIRTLLQQLKDEQQDL